MAKRLEFPQIFKNLLDGGHICSIDFSAGNSTKYVVWSSSKSTPIGHITESQLMSLLENDIVELIKQPIQKDKYNNLYSYYKLKMHSGEPGSPHKEDKNGKAKI